MSVAIEGEGAGALPDRGATTSWRAAVRAAFEAAGRPVPRRRAPLRESDPAEPRAGLERRGLDGRAWWRAMPWPAAASRATALLDAATRAEGHPDNVAAALLGGLTVSCATGDRSSRCRCRCPRHPMGGAHPGSRGLDQRGARGAARLGVARGRRVQPPARGPAPRRAERGAPRSPPDGAGRSPAPAGALAALSLAARRGGGGARRRRARLRAVAAPGPRCSPRWRARASAVAPRDGGGAARGRAAPGAR